MINSLNLIFAWRSRSYFWSWKPRTFLPDDSLPSYDVIKSVDQFFFMKWLYTLSIYIIHNVPFSAGWLHRTKNPRFWASGIRSGPPCKNQIKAIFHHSRVKNRPLDFFINLLFSYFRPKSSPSPLILGHGRVEHRELQKKNPSYSCFTNRAKYRISRVEIGEKWPRKK